METETKICQWCGEEVLGQYEKGSFRDMYSVTARSWGIIIHRSCFFDNNAYGRLAYDPIIQNKATPPFVRQMRLAQLKAEFAELTSAQDRQQQDPG